MHMTCTRLATLSVACAKVLFIKVPLLIGFVRHGRLVAMFFLAFLNFLR